MTNTQHTACRAEILGTLAAYGIDVTFRGSSAFADTFAFGADADASAVGEAADALKRLAAERRALATPDVDAYAGLFSLAAYRVGADYNATVRAAQAAA